MGKYYCLGGLMGPPWSQMVDLGPLGRDGVGGWGVWVWDGVGGVLGFQLLVKVEKIQ